MGTSKEQGVVGRDPGRGAFTNQMAISTDDRESASHPGCLSGPGCPGKLWTKAMKDAVEPKPTLDENDGEFWMCYKDFLRLRN